MKVRTAKARTSAPVSDRRCHYAHTNVQIPHHDCDALLEAQLTRAYINNGPQSLWEALMDF